MINNPELASKIARLDARDKLLRQQMTKRAELSRAQAYIGSCTDMCPERERYLRLGFQPSIFERDNMNRPDEYAMIKEYRRAGADQEEPLPHELRTIGALNTTMDFLVCNIMDDSRSKSQKHALEWYDFLWDRLRAIRKDITQQSICDLKAATLVERCTRFHVHSCYAMNRVKDFDVDMNKRNLNDCLQMLRQLYHDMKTTKGLNCPNEFEFQRYDILLHLNNDLLATNALMKTCDHRNISELRFITQIFTAYSTNDYYRFFRLMYKADYMTSCILSLYVNHMRAIGLRTIAGTCTPKQTVWYPCEFIVESLGFDTLQDLEELATSCGIEMKEKEMRHYLLLHRDQSNSLKEANLIPPKLRLLVESKMSSKNVGQLVYGLDTLPNNPYRQNPLTCTNEIEESEMMTDLYKFTESSTTVEPTISVPMIKTETAALVPIVSEYSWFKDGAEIDVDFDHDHEEEEQVSEISSARASSNSVTTSPSTSLDRRVSVSFTKPVEVVTPTREKVVPVDLPEPPRVEEQPAILQATEVVYEDTSPQIDEESDEVAPLINVKKRSLNEIADLMPAGRFRRICVQAPVRVDSKETTVSENKVKKKPPSVILEDIAQIKERLDDEREANNYLFRILRELL